jgi:aldehyde dehydrogenase (NAD+)
MARAAKTLTPVTLELGGKNPVLVTEMEDGLLTAAVKEIVGTKVYFAGEFCQSHDFCLIVESMWDRFLAKLKSEIEALGERRMVRLIHKKHHSRVKHMLESHNGSCMPEVPQIDDDSLSLPLTAVIEPNNSDPIMQDEIFGPLLAVFKVASIEDAIKRANASPTGKPLVSYYYGQDMAMADMWVNSTSSGSLAINSGPMRMQSNFNSAIHGVGNSGLGGASIWGEHVFNTFSHAKHVVRPKDGAFAGSIWGPGPYIPKL